MSQKVFYRYNPATAQYERVFPDTASRLYASMRVYVVAFLIVVFIASVLYYMIDSPRERMLRRENRMLQQRFEMLDRRADQALAVMEDIAERDNNFYRVMMLDRLDQMIVSQIRSFDFLAKETASQKNRTAHIPAIQPVPEKYLRTMASGYGMRRDPIYGTMKFHEGMDFSAPLGTPVYATADGTVTTASWQSAYGNMVEINHGYNYTTRYAHMSKIIARAGQTVKRGDLIGLVGNTGKSTGSHLHYEVRYRGAPQNPVNYYYYDLSPEQYDEIIRLAENAGHVMD